MSLDDDRLLQQRLTKLERLRQLGVNPYPARYERTLTAADALAKFDDLQEQPFSFAGRIVGGVRGMGRVTFFHLADGTDRIQVNLREDVLGSEAYAIFKNFDTGDWLGVTGKLFRTRTGEITVLGEQVTMLAKALLPLPEKWHGLVDVEKRYRQRYLDLIANAEVRQIFRRRSAVIAAVRCFFDRHGFVEVETPVLQPIYGGAAAKPFETFHHALHRQLYLRIATELYLKRLVVGGLERVYEIGKVFRNEGISTKHNPEYTLLEAYQAFADYRDVMATVEQLVSFVADEVLGTLEIPYQDRIIDLRPPWPRISLREAIRQHSGVDFAQYPDREALYNKMLDMGLRVDRTMGRGKLIDDLLSTFVEPKLIQPTFLTDYPVELSPLAKRKPDEPELVERFEAFMGGIEIANAFSELNDPIDQRARFEQQVADRAAGDEEAHVMDLDFLAALEQGMPPTGGLGIGIDRLVMLLTDQQSIREVILFPQLRSKD